ncbi:hypothetical protein BS47DRAFT_1348490 [Hydnum rufescens UP504]|uniref:Uncharacterized protein n=1 Tax=Hydnum rufescens UP504 TaxID=1448309 RepID=A0A9P6AR08_9AGAM|nr:hypothetical protein BS47DRAFT_1348490 [Hydnum rufescens UP504]
MNCTPMTRIAPLYTGTADASCPLDRQDMQWRIVLSSIPTYSPIVVIGMIWSEI